MKAGLGTSIGRSMILVLVLVENDAGRHTSVWRLFTKFEALSSYRLLNNRYVFEEFKSSLAHLRSGSIQKPYDGKADALARGELQNMHEVWHSTN